MESDSISVEIIENSETELISLSVVRLGSVSSRNIKVMKIENSFITFDHSPSCVGPVDIVVSPTRGPPDQSEISIQYFQPIRDEYSTFSTNQR